MKFIKSLMLHYYEGSIITKLVLFLFPSFIIGGMFMDFNWGDGVYESLWSYRAETHYSYVIVASLLLFSYFYSVYIQNKSSIK